jgi:hypothetical protein
LSSFSESSSGLTKNTQSLLGTLDKHDKGVDHHLPSSGQTDFRVIGCQEEKKSSSQDAPYGNDNGTASSYLRRTGLFAISLKFSDFFIVRLLQPLVLIKLDLNSSRRARGSAALVMTRSSWSATPKRQDGESI